MRATPLFLSSLAVVSLGLGLPSCGGGGGGGGGVAAVSTTEFLVSSTGDAELFSLCSDVTSLRLQGTDGALTDNLLVAPVTLEFVGMGEVAEWLTRVEIAPGAYESMQVVFDRDSVHAVAPSGAEVLLEVPAETWEVELVSDLFVAPGESGRVEVVLDLDESLVGDLSPAPPQFLPAGDVFVLDGGDVDLSIDELTGMVVAANLPDLTFGIEVFRDEFFNDPMGVLDVQIQSGTTLIDDTGIEFPTVEAFFASLRLGLTVVEVHGVLGESGVLRANRVEIEDQAGVQPPVVEIEGMVLFVEGASTSGQEGEFILLIQEIEEGADIADPVLEGLGNPSAIDVAWDAQTVFFGRNGQELDAGDLMAGQSVDVSFNTFRAPPFLAAEVEIDADSGGMRCLEGEIVDVDGESGEITIDRGSDDYHDDYHDDIDGDEVTVDLNDAEIVLNIRSRPSLEPDELVTGMKITVCGTLEERPVDRGDGMDEDELVFVATEAKLKPGHLIKGEPGESDPDGGSFELVAGQIVQTFGDDVNTPRSNVLVPDDADIRNDADSKSDLFDLIESIDEGETLDLKIKGLGSGELDEIVAHEIKVKVRGQSGPGGGDDDDDDDDGDDDDDDDD